MPGVFCSMNGRLVMAGGVSLGVAGEFEKFQMVIGVVRLGWNHQLCGALLHFTY